MKNETWASVLVIIYHYYNITPKIILPLILLSLFALVILLLLTFIIFLEMLEKSKTTQYPFNIILDRIFPLLAIISPTIIIILIKTEEFSWIYKIAFILFIHIFFLIPLMHFWSTHRSWVLPNVIVNTWSSPKLYLDLLIATIYPTIWFLFFICLRALRIGLQNDIQDLLPSGFMLDTILLLLFILPYTIYWLICIIYIYKIIRDYFWNTFQTLSYSLHLFLLKYTFYFKLMETIYKANFIFFNYVSLNSILNENTKPKEFSLFRRGIAKIYYYPLLSTGFLLTLVICELLFTFQIYYGYYLLFIFPLLRSFLKAFNLFGKTSFIKDVCMVDYLTKNNTNIRYPIMFWVFMRDPEASYGFYIETTEEEYALWKKLFTEASLRHKKYFAKYFIGYTKRLLFKVNKKNYPYLVRIKAAYLEMHYTRW